MWVYVCSALERRIHCTHALVVQVSTLDCPQNMKVAQYTRSAGELSETGPHVSRSLCVL
jgi:hypothetical protein